MSWKIVKELKEKRAKAFADAQAIREQANKEDRDLSADEETRHATILADVENFAKRIDREERANAVGEAITETRNLIGRDNVAGNSIGMAQKDFSQYSLLRAIQKRINGQPLDGVEGEISKEIALRSGKDPQGFYFPVDASFQNRTLLNTTTGAGAVPTITAPSFIEMLRNKVVLAKLGATLLPGMTGNFSLPKQTQGATAYWIAEGNAPTTSNQAVAQVGFSPKTVGAYTDLSRKFINQSAFDAEAFVRNDLATVLAIELDRAALNGSGAGAEPLGIFDNTDVEDVVLSAGALTYPKVVEFETLVSTANADAGSLAYVTNSKVRGKLKTTLENNTAGAQYIWRPDNTVNGYNAAVTNSIPSNFSLSSADDADLSGMIFGNWADLVMAMWGGLDILVDPYTGSNAGTVRVVALQDVDIKLRHAESFAKCNGIEA